eukprot:Skav229146  [mRNA]  locus=scaffold1875:191744:193832:- [translate_table: standard]
MSSEMESENTSSTSCRSACAAGIGGTDPVAVAFTLCDGPEGSVPGRSKESSLALSPEDSDEAAAAAFALPLAVEGR